MKHLLLLLFLAFTASAFSQKIKETEALIEAMHQKYQGKWFNAFTFVQETIQYEEDGSERDRKIWYEAIQYPKNFRIDYGPIEEGNASLFRNDSMYRFKNGVLEQAVVNPQQFLLMKGGLYHFEVAEVIKMLKDYGYDTEVFRKDRFQGKKVYVLGAKEGDLSAPQFWIDAKHFYLVRRIRSLNNGKVLDVHYGEHLKSNGGWVEQTVKFYLDGRYLQLENYKEIDTSPNLDAGVFDPAKFGAIHWKK